MAKLSILAGATSQSVNLFIQDSSKSNGAGLPGLAFNTAGLAVYYSFAGANAGSTAIALVTLAAVNSAWASGGFKELDAVNMPGFYRLDLPNTVLAAGNGRSVALSLQGAVNMAQLPVEIELTATDNQNADFGSADITAIKAKTDGLSFTVTGQIDANIQYVNDVLINGNGQAATPWGP